MVERGNHNPDVVGSNPTIIIFIFIIYTYIKLILNITEGSIAWLNAPVLGTGDQRFESFSSDFILYVYYITYFLLFLK